MNYLEERTLLCSPILGFIHLVLAHCLMYGLLKTRLHDTGKLMLSRSHVNMPELSRYWADAASISPVPAQGGCFYLVIFI